MSSIDLRLKKPQENDSLPTALSLDDKSNIPLISQIGQTLQLASCSLTVPLIPLSKSQSTYSIQTAKNPFQRRSEIPAVDNTVVSRAVIRTAAAGVEVINEGFAELIHNTCRIPGVNLLCRGASLAFNESCKQIDKVIPDSWNRAFDNTVKKIKENNSETLDYLEENFNIPKNEAGKTIEGVMLLATVTIGPTRASAKIASEVTKLKPRAIPYTPRGKVDTASFVNFTSIETFAKSFVESDVVIESIYEKAGRAVYQVKDVADKTLFYIKENHIFNGVGPEIAGYSHLKNASLQESRLPNILGAGSYYSDNRKIALLALTEVEGKDIVYWIDNFAKQRDFVGECKEAMHRSGLALGDLHKSTRNGGIITVGENADAWISLMKDWTPFLRQSLAKDYNLHLDLKFSPFDKVTMSFKNGREVTSIAHYDTHGGNLIHSPWKKVGLIDPSQLVASIDGLGMPIGFGALDYHIFLRSIDSSATHRGIPHSIVQEWTHTFDEAYRSVNPLPFTVEADRFARLFTNLWILSTSDSKPVLTKFVQKYNKEFGDL